MKKVKVGILGSRGIPNNYGGFEQFAQYLSEGLVQGGIDVTVYNPHYHPFQESNWKGVNIIHKKNRERSMGSIGQFFYDLRCILDSRQRGFDIILQLGYNSSSIWYGWHPKGALVCTNMDGLDWKRTKFSGMVRRFLQYAEKLAVRKSHFVIADSKAIQSYLDKKYSIKSVYLTYGATPFESPDEKVLQAFGVNPYHYDLMISRLEPENNVEMILEAFQQSTTEHELLIIGHKHTPYAKWLMDKHPDKRIRFLGANFNINVLNNLRYFSNLYVHGHTVGGTNPSLLEAISARAMVGAHYNAYNYEVLTTNAYYFTDVASLKHIFDTVQKNIQDIRLDKNMERIKEQYLWEEVVHSYREFFLKVLQLDTAVTFKTGSVIEKRAAI